MEQQDCIRVKDSKLYLFYIIFIFKFSNLGLEVSMISYITVTNCYIFFDMTYCHTSVTVTQSYDIQKNIEGSGIIRLYYMFDM